MSEFSPERLIQVHSGAPKTPAILILRAKVSETSWYRAVLSALPCMYSTTCSNFLKIFYANGVLNNLHRKLAEKPA